MDGRHGRAILLGRRAHAFDCRCRYDKLANVILNVYNFGQDYDVYWDNFKVGSTSPATYESVVTGLTTISASDVEVTGLYLTNPGQAYGVFASGALNNIKIANNRIQDVGGAGTAAQIKGVYLPNGADNVTISNNVFSKIVAGTPRAQMQSTSVTRTQRTRTPAL